MDTNYDLSEAEQRSLNTVYQLLGSNLADYLLSGLSETRITNKRAFEAWGSTRDMQSVPYRFEMISETEPGLPMGRDPLVLAAIIDLLWNHQSLNGTFNFHVSEIIERLNWPQSIESQAEVKKALERYLLTAFCLIDETNEDQERVFARYDGYRRLLVGYETTTVGMRLTATRKQIQLTFIPELIECLKSDSKRFLGIEFQRLRGFRRLENEKDSNHV